MQGAWPLEGGEGGRRVVEGGEGSVTVAHGVVTGSNALLENKLATIIDF